MAPLSLCLPLAKIKQPVRGKQRQILSTCTVQVIVSAPENCIIQLTIKKNSQNLPISRWKYLKQTNKHQSKINHDYKLKRLFHSHTLNYK
jgi:hypothetical protein